MKNFEITIRLLGGLLSSYQLTGDKRLLALAEIWAIVCSRYSIRLRACLTYL